MLMPNGVGKKAAESMYHLPSVDMSPLVSSPSNLRNLRNLWMLSL
jgi:hypothetical protein